jgi:chemotaxis protein CheD
MLERYHAKLRKKLTILQPGDYRACTDDRILATVLGSCVAVCLWDEETGVCGMNHFMLPGDFRSVEVFSDTTGRYGMFAMELLLGEMIKLGSRRAKLKAKVFGAGHVLNYDPSQNSVPENNIKFVKAFLRIEGIEIVKEDLGGFQGRKILFFTRDRSVFVKKLASTVEARLIEEEEAYREKIAQEQKKSRLTLF